MPPRLTILYTILYTISDGFPSPLRRSRYIMHSSTLDIIEYEEISLVVLHHEAVFGDVNLFPHIGFYFGALLLNILREQIWVLLLL